MLESTTLRSMEASQATDEPFESAQTDEIQVKLIQEIDDVLVGPQRITRENAARIGKRVIQDDHLKKRIIQEAKKRIFIGTAVTDKDYGVIEKNGKFQDTTMAKLMKPSAALNRLHLIDGLSVQKVDGEEKIAINIRKMEGEEEMTFDSINNHVMADILKVVLFDEDAEINDPIV